MITRFVLLPLILFFGLVSLMPASHCHFNSRAQVRVRAHQKKHSFAVPFVQPQVFHAYQYPATAFQHVQTIPVPVQIQVQPTIQLSVPRVQWAAPQGDPGSPPTAAYFPVAHSPPPPVKASMPSLLSQKCARCHTEGKLRGGVQLFNQQGEFHPNVSGMIIKRAVISGAMPPGNPLTLQDQQTILSNLPHYP